MSSSGDHRYRLVRDIDGVVDFRCHGSFVYGTGLAVSPCPGFDGDAECCRREPIHRAQPGQRRRRRMRRSRHSRRRVLWDRSSLPVVVKLMTSGRSRGNAEIAAGSLEQHFGWWQSGALPGELFAFHVQSAASRPQIRLPEHDPDEVVCPRVEGVRLTVGADLPHRPRRHITVTRTSQVQSIPLHILGLASESFAEPDARERFTIDVFAVSSYSPSTGM